MSVVVSSPKSLATRLVEIGLRRSSVLYELVHVCAEFDASGDWALEGSPTAAHWIASALDVEVCTTREWIRIGKALENLPVLDAAFASRRLSFSKIRVLTRIATSANETELLGIAERVPAGRLAVALAAWSQRNEDPEKRNERHRLNRGLWHRTEPDGMCAAVLRLPPLSMGRLLAAIDAQVRSTSVTKREQNATAVASHISLAQLRADALVELVTTGGARVETEVILHVRADGCSLDDGTPITDSVVERIAPEAFLRALIHDAESKPINASGRHRHPTTRQKRVINERDRACIDCGSTDWHQYDHVPDFNTSKRTLVDEVFLRCSRCHRLRHERAS